MPEVIAHRGANQEAPENSLDAFRIAVELGADGIELDIQLTADGVPVVLHDPAMPVTAGQPTIPVRFLSLVQVRKRGVIPTLDEAIELVAGRCRLYVEIKDSRALDGVLQRVRKLGDQVAVHSFDHRVIVAAADSAPKTARGILLVSYLLDPAGAMSAARARDLWQHVDRIDAELVQQVHREGGRVVAWTVNDDDRARELISLGVDGLCTDRTREMRQLVDHHATLAQPNSRP